jgi:DNA adenine methylase
MQYHAGELQKEVNGYLNSREIFYDIRERLECRGFTDIQRAAMFYVCVKISFGADTRSYGGCKSGSRLITEDFDRFKERLDGVTIENKDFESLIEQYDNKDSFFYCDPPYYSTERHYTAKFSKADHLRLNARLKELKGKFLLSYNDHEFIRDLYKSYTVISVERQNNLSSGNYKELFIKNY